MWPLLSFSVADMNDKMEFFFSFEEAPGLSLYILADSTGLMQILQGLMAARTVKG